MRRILLVSYAFPPNVVVGGLRWQKLIGYAVQRGWGVDVICLDPSCSELRDPTSLHDLPPNVRVYGVREKPLLIERLAKQLLTILAKLWKRQPRAQRVDSMNRAETLQKNMIKGSRSFTRMWHAYFNFARFGLWAEEAARLGKSIVGAQHTLVITSGPPHMAHQAGWRLARQTHKHFVMDMRDPWSLVQRVPEHFATPLYFKLAAKFERRAVEEASLIVTNTEAAAHSLQALYPFLQNRIVTVMNGSDEEPLPVANQGPTFVIAYAGAIYLDRDPRPLFQAAARVIQELKLSPDQLSIRFMGSIYGNCSPMDIARQECIGPFVSYEATRPRHEALQFLARASMLLSLPQDSDMAVPSKLFEYIRFPAWILALTQAESATELLLRGSAADVVDPCDVDGIAEVIRRCYLEHSLGIKPAAVGSDSRFSRRRQAKILFDALDSRFGAPLRSTTTFEGA